MNQPDSLVADSSALAQTISSDSARPCLACGYDLQGLGEEPRCPECGLLNIPEGYRRQVWELVDSGKWFFSSCFGVFRKRPPGWWWSLDRPGDVRKAVRFACAFLTIGVLIIVACGLLCGSVVRRETIVVIYPQTRDATVAREALYSSYQTTFRLGGMMYTNESHMIKIPPGQPARIPKTAINSFEFSLLASVPTLFIGALLILHWFLPVAVGLSTQIRKSLPTFARPPQTIWAASLYESHRVLYVAVFVALLLGADTYFRCKGWAPAGRGGSLTWPLLGLTAGSFATFGWIGPLRSDYTNQLIRSSRHAIRILFMYCWLFPLFITGTLAFFYITRGL